MKKHVILSSVLLLLMAACTNDNKLAPKEQQKVEDQVAKDQAAQDSMEAVIMQQIEATTTDTAVAQKP